MTQTFQKRTEQERSGLWYSHNQGEGFWLILSIPFAESSWIFSKYQIFLIMVSYRGSDIMKLVF